MTAHSAYDQLRQLLAVTEQCAAQARIAKQHAQRYAQYYRANAEEFRRQAALCRFPEIRERLLRVAASNERLFNLAEGTDDDAGKEGRAEPRETLVFRSHDHPSVELQDRLASAEALYLSTATVIRETREAINRTLERLALRSDRTPAIIPAQQRALAPASESRTETGRETTPPRKLHEPHQRLAIPEPQASTYNAYYQASAVEFRKQAARARIPEVRVRLLRIASLHERLAELGEGQAVRSEGVPGFDRPASDREAAMIETQSGKAPVMQRPHEDPVAQASRHVKEAEDRIARQEALVARLSQDAKYVALAAAAKEILKTLKHTLSLARDHLALEMRK